MPRIRTSGHLLNSIHISKCSTMICQDTVSPWIYRKTRNYVAHTALSSRHASTRPRDEKCKNRLWDLAAWCPLVRAPTRTCAAIEFRSGSKFARIGILSDSARQKTDQDPAPNAVPHCIDIPLVVSTKTGPFGVSPRSDILPVRRIKFPGDVRKWALLANQKVIVLISGIDQQFALPGPRDRKWNLGSAVVNKLHHLSGLVPSFPLPKENGREDETV